MASRQLLVLSYEAFADENGQRDRDCERIYIIPIGYGPSAWGPNVVAGEPFNYARQWQWEEAKKQQQPKRH